MADLPVIIDADTGRIKKDTDITPIDDSDSPYTVGESEDLILVDSSGGAVTVILPAASASNIKGHYTIKDAAGSAATHNITINPNGVQTLDGASSVTLAVNYNCITFMSNGVDGYVILTLF